MGFLDSLFSIKSENQIIKEILPQRLEWLIDVFGIQKKNLAEDLDVSNVAVTKYTKGMSLPSLDVVVKIADRFNVTSDFLLGRTTNPILKEDFVYFNPIGEVEYNFSLSDGTILEGKVGYTFGLTIWNMDLSKDELALNQFLCFHFEDTQDNQRLYDALFLKDEINVRYFLYMMERSLGLPFMNEYKGLNDQGSQYICNLLVENICGIKPPEGKNIIGVDTQYLANLTKPKDNEIVRLNHLSTSGAQPHLQAWRSMDSDKRQELLMRRLRRIKSLG